MSCRVSQARLVYRRYTSTRRGCITAYFINCSFIYFLQNVLIVEVRLLIFNHFYSVLCLDNKDKISICTFIQWYIIIFFWKLILKAVWLSLVNLVNNKQGACMQHQSSSLICSIDCDDINTAPERDTQLILILMLSVKLIGYKTSVLHKCCMF